MFYWLYRRNDPIVCNLISLLILLTISFFFCIFVQIFFIHTNIDFERSAGREVFEAFFSWKYSEFVSARDDNIKVCCLC